ENRARFNSDTYSPTSDELTRFPSRLKQKHTHIDERIDLSLSIQSEPEKKKPTYPKNQPSSFRKG
ncbi:TPA: MobQ family relaxase, partial [Klebsiella michiganensis]